MLSELRHWYKPDVISYSAAISACGAGEKWGLAAWLVEVMKEERSWPNMTSYAAAISACEKGRAWKEALGRFLELCHWYEPDVISYNAAIQGAPGSTWTTWRTWGIPLAGGRVPYPGINSRPVFLGVARGLCGG